MDHVGDPVLVQDALHGGEVPDVDVDGVGGLDAVAPDEAEPLVGRVAVERHHLGPSRTRVSTVQAPMHPEAPVTSQVSLVMLLFSSLKGGR